MCVCVHTHLIICSHIDTHRQAAFWSDPSTGSVQTQLPYRNAHSIYTEITQTQNPLTIGHYHSLHTHIQLLMTRAYSTPVFQRINSGKGSVCVYKVPSHWFLASCPGWNGCVPDP